MASVVRSPTTPQPGARCSHRCITTLRGQPSTAMAAPTQASVETRLLRAQPISPEAFKPFGQVIGWGDDGKEYDHSDAQLRGFSGGTPRFYIMRLPERGLQFTRITYHQKARDPPILKLPQAGLDLTTAGAVTQCLGLLAPVGHWYMAVARPSGSVEAFPAEQDLTVFRIPHGVFIKMEQGTWHAGPYFQGQPHMDFYNLELSDTNVTDHNTHDYRRQQGLLFQIVNDEQQRE